SSNYETLPQQIQDGKVAQSTIDESVRRILRVKFIRGLFEKPYVDETRYKGAYLRPDAVALAREAAAKACVLLKNEHDTLPISKSAKKIALIGPLGDARAEMLGCWASRGRPQDAISLAAGIRAKLSSNTKLIVTQGCDITNSAHEQISKAVADAKSA